MFVLSISAKLHVNVLLIINFDESNTSSMRDVLNHSQFTTFESCKLPYFQNQQSNFVRIII